MAIGAAAAIINVAVDHVLDVQVVVVCVGGLLLVVGAAVIVRGWQSRATSEWRGLVVAAGFFSACVGVFVTAIGSGLFH
ncbi:MAG: hypothetical protein KJ006_04245 [Thermoleophilia bacterium]|nr:MAG: hypothetical protein F9K43_24130 [Bauldia sp.]MCL4286842.1 hypothetical protein [Thermoleophilia bacterium]